jgi:hypothetical protein
MKLVISSFLVLSAFIILPIETLARTPKRFNYVGVDLCKMCHKKEKLGNQYNVWTNTTHSKAFYTLGTLEAKEIATKLGIKNPQQSGKCLRCHATCHVLTEEQALEDIRIEDGVQCEACHGPGEEYMYLEVMEDLEEAKDMGLIMPTEETCRKCHNPESPTYNPKRDTTPDGKTVDFYYPKRKKMIDHHKPVKETK